MLFALFLALCRPNTGEILPKTNLHVPQDLMQSRMQREAKSTMAAKDGPFRVNVMTLSDGAQRPPRHDIGKQEW